MSDEEDQVDEIASDEEEEGKKKGGLKKILMILVPLLLLGGGGAGAYFMGMLDSVLGIEAEAEGEEGEEGEGDEHGEGKDDGHGKDDKGGKKDKKGKDKKKDKKDKKGKDKKKDKKDKDKKGKDKEGYGGGDDGAFLKIPTMLVNLASDDGTPRHLRLTVQLELEDPEDRAAIEEVMPRVINEFQVYLRELRVRDLRGSAGIYRLNVELLWRVNQAVAPAEIKDVLFQEILIQ